MPTTPSELALRIVTACRRASAKRGHSEEDAAELIRYEELLYD
jgi:hypothetical protein